jgi:transcriptional regulator with XRE-family HTH domain
MLTETARLFGRNVRAIRMKQGLTQAALAEMAGLNRSYLGGVERGARNITMENIERIARALAVPVAALFEPVDDR